VADPSDPAPEFNSSVQVTGCGRARAPNPSLSAFLGSDPRSGECSSRP